MASVISARTALQRALARVGRAPEWPPIAVAMLGLLATVEVVLRSGAAGGTSGSEVAVNLLLAWAGTVALGLARGQVPVAACTVVLANAATFAGGQAPAVAAMAAQLVVAYLLGRGRSWQPSALVLALLATQALAAAPADRGLLVAVLLSSSAAAAGLGRASRARRVAAERAATRQTIADTLLEHAARGERARIARELHDVVAHHISMIAVQAEAARLTTPGMPPQGAARLLAIGDTARMALTEMRRLLGVLREDTGPEPTRAPQPGLQQVNELIDGVRDSTRASTRLIVRGRVAALDPGVELTAYRLIQEALTNVRRHAPGAAVDVELEYTDAALQVRVRDNGPGGPPSAGHGLLGMRERAAMVGGTVSAGPAPGSGFLVQASLPRTAS